MKKSDTKYPKGEKCKRVLTEDDYERAREVGGDPRVIAKLVEIIFGRDPAAVIPS